MQGTTMTANRAWAEMPPYARFETLGEAARVAFDYAQTAKEERLAPRLVVPYATDRGELMVQSWVGPELVPAHLTYHAAGQLAELAGVPQGYLRSLPADLAAVNLAYGLKVREAAGREVVALSYQAPGDSAVTLRAMTSEVYKRLWSAKLFALLDKAIEQAGGGWVPVPAYPNDLCTGPEDVRVATREDVGPWTRVQEGSQIMRGKSIYYNPGVQRDTFVLLVNTRREVGEGLFRYVMLWNGESGGVSLGMECGLVDGFCGNNIGWGAKDVRRFRFTHVGAIGARTAMALGRMLQEIARAEGGEERKAIAESKRWLLNDSVKTGESAAASVVKAAAALTDLPQSTVKAGMAAAEKAGRYGDPRSAWSVLGGLTEYSQTLRSVAERVDVDRAAGRILEAASKRVA